MSIRTGWFWHKSQSPKELKKLLEIYYKSVGRNCVLLLNVPPNTTGLISETDVHRLKELRNAINTIFSTDYAKSCSLKTSSERGGRGGGFGPENVLDDDHLWTYWAPKDNGYYPGSGFNKEEHWIEFNGRDGELRFNVVRIQEAVGLGQRIGRHEVYLDGKRVAKGTTVGYKRLHRIKDGVVNGSVVRLRITRSRGVPLISSFGLHYDPFWKPSPLDNY